MLQQTQVYCDWGAGRAQWLGHRTRDREVAGFESRQERREKVYSTWSTFCADSFRYPFHITALARKRSLSFCQKCRWLVTARHACTIYIWLCMKWHGMVHGCMVYTEHAETAAVSRGTNYVTTKQCCKYITSAGIPNGPYKARVIHLGSHAAKAQWVCLRAKNSAVYRNDHHHHIHNWFCVQDGEKRRISGQRCCGTLRADDG